MSNDKKGCLVDVPRNEQRVFRIDNKIEKRYFIAAANARQAAETFWYQELWNNPGNHSLLVSEGCSADCWDDCDVDNDSYYSTENSVEVYVGYPLEGVPFVCEEYRYVFVDGDQRKITKQAFEDLFGVGHPGGQTPDKAIHLKVV